METIKISDIKPAEYNPRKISDEGFENLKKSLQELGVIKPILVNAENSVIIAGHQRTKAMQAIGITECMAFSLKNVDYHDECRFNQLHNKCEIELSEEAPVVKITKQLKLGINIVEPKFIEVQKIGRTAQFTQQLAFMLLKYGEYGLPICHQDGNVAISSSYALACKNSNTNMHVLVLEDDKIERAKFYMSKDYGKFNYDGLKRQTFIQGFAQLKRLRNTDKKTKISRLYEYLVIPYLQNINLKDLRILDFGAGQYDYATRLMNEGYNIHPVDPYHNRNHGNILVGMNKRHFMKVCEDLDNYGRYDIVICDSVLNSVDSEQSWYDVIYSCSGLLKLGGDLFISGRPLTEKISDNKKSKKITARTNTLYFIDDMGFSANFRNGAWFFQKFDNEEEFIKLKAAITDKPPLNKYQYPGGYGFHLKKTKELPLETILPSVMREWDMQLPNGKSYGLQDYIKESLTKVYNNENRCI